MSTSPQPPPVGFSTPGNSAQKYPDDMMIIPVEHYMKDSGLRQDVGDLMSGDMFRSSNARVKLGRKGYSDAFLKKMQDTGWRWKYMQPPNGLQFGLVPADDEIVAMIPEMQCSSPSKSMGSQGANYSMAPRNSTSPETPTPFGVPLASLGLSIVSMGSDLVLKINDPEMLKQALRQAQFAKNIYGKRAIWRMKMRGGRPFVDPNTIKIASLAKRIRVLKIVSNAGRLCVVGSIFVSGAMAASENTAKAWTKFGLDMVMIAVAQIPVVGWVVSGIYFITDAIFNLSGIDWWSSVWDNVIAPSDAMTKEKIAMLDALAMAMH